MQSYVTVTLVFKTEDTEKAKEMAENALSKIPEDAEVYYYDVFDVDVL